MAGGRKAPLQSSSEHNIALGGGAGGGGGGGGKTIEETYQKKTQLEHILLRPDTYIGSVEKHTQNLWVYEEGEMVHRPISYVPGLYKIFDEILVNAADNKQRDPSMDSVRVTIDPEANFISIYNNGDGVPVEIHKEEGVYVPELIFGHLLTSSNYDDHEKKTTGGRNGYGAKLTNIFSTEFVVETADGKREKKYKQVFKNNMGTKTQPLIKDCKAGENWTKVSFKPDLEKFNMTHLENDVVALMKKRVVDLAGTLGKTVKVELNGQRVPVKCFGDYVNLYLQTAAKLRPEPLPRFTERVNDRWEVCLSLSEGQFQQVSFVNGIATIKGGTHVDYITTQITNHVISIVNKKNKTANLKAHTVKNHIWVFVNALIDNPAFDSQTKETLTTRPASFGSTCELSQEFLKKVAKSGVVESLLTWADFKQNKEFKKTDGAKKQRITGITKLEDANDAGGKNSGKCTLILTEGDSAKALAMAGIAVVGRDHYGVFPLRGKLLNVREASHKQIMDNAEIQNIKQILGLQHGKEYDSVKSLRYGHLMIMTDQDHDGSHIKGLLINFIHSFWPSLLKVPSFLVEFITPIVKATNKRSGKVLSFYSMPEYEAWKENEGGNAHGWSIKYYKGLGTSTSKEGKEYFQDLIKHKKDFLWSDETDGDAIEMAFSKKKIEARKNWLRQFEPGTHLDQQAQLIKYKDFVNKELILFSIADLQRSIPSMVDGLKPGQRKILFCSFKRNFTKEAKVAQFSGYVSEHSAYHHGEQSLASTIIGMAQDFVGSNNINLLLPNGQFGTRNQGGKDHASARYIYTKLSPLTRFLFPKEDDILLDYLNEDGQSIEPTWYMPILPMVLVNGSEGIGTGWSTYIPNYNPKDIIANIRRLLSDEPMVPMDPWYRSFKGSIEKTATKETGVTYTVSGVFEEADGSMLRITELPIRRWTQDYKEFLESMMTGNDKIKEPFIVDYREHNDDLNVNFEVYLSEENLKMAMHEGILKKFKLTSTISTSNMHLFDSKGVIKKYDKPEEILEEFFHLRLEYYEKRKKVLLENLELDLLKLDNKVRFILGVVKDEIIVKNRKQADLFIELQRKGFTPFHKKLKANDADGESAEAGEDGSDESSEHNNAARASGYEYLLSLAIGTLTEEEVKKLLAERDRLCKDVEHLRASTPHSLWMKDLDSFEKALDEMLVEEAENGKARTALQGKEATGARRATAPKIRKKKETAPKETSKEPVLSPTEASEVGTSKPANNKPKGRGRAKKAAPAQDVDSDGEDEEIVMLKNRLAKYNINSSPEETGMEVNGAEPRKREMRAAAQKQQSVSFAEISDNDSGDDYMPTIMEEDVEHEKEEAEVSSKEKNKGGSRKNGTSEMAKAGTDEENKKRRGGGRKKTTLVEGQKPITEDSPEKKVRKMRPSPFNKKSGSVLERLRKEQESDAAVLSESSPSEVNEPPVIQVKARPQRANRGKTKYVVSDSDSGSEDLVEVTDDSDFDEDDN